MKEIYFLCNDMEVLENEELNLNEILYAEISDTFYIYSPTLLKDRWIDGTGLENQRSLKKEYLHSTHYLSLDIPEKLEAMLFSDDIEMFELGKQILKNTIL